MNECSDYDLQPNNYYLKLITLCYPLNKMYILPLKFAMDLEILEKYHI